MSKQDRGEHSRGDELSEHEKPFKKAKFLWEVKGKHHLKDSYKNNNDTSQDNKVHVVPKSNGGVKEVNANSSCENCEDDEDCNCLEDFLTKSEAIMVNDELNFNQTEDEDNNSPLSLLGIQEKSNDYYLRKWQARQIARGFVDNTINSVLETWTTRPFDAAEFVENCRNDGQVEDDAILMAIQEHGLQSRGESRGSSRLRFSSELKEQMAAILVRETSEHYADLEQGFDGCLQTEENMEFMNAAVSAAIEKKGLSYGF